MRPDGDTRVGAGGGPAVDQRRIGCATTNHAVVVVIQPEIDPHSLAVQSGRRDTRMLEGLPGDLQNQALLRVHLHRLTRRDAEKRRVELVDVRQEAAGSLGGAAACRRIIAVPPRMIPARGGHRRDRAATTRQQRPERGRVVSGAGETTTQPDDRHWFVLRHPPPPAAASMG